MFLLMQQDLRGMNLYLYLSQLLTTVVSMTTKINEVNVANVSLTSQDESS